MTTIVDPQFIDTPSLRTKGFPVAGLVGRGKTNIKGSGMLTSVVFGVTTAAWTPTAGAPLMSLTYTPKVIGSTLKYRGKITAGINNANWLHVAAFNGNTLMDVQLQANYTSTVTNTVYPEFSLVTTSLTPVVINLRWAINAAGTATLNSATSGTPGTFNDAIDSWIEVEEWV